MIKLSNCRSLLVAFLLVLSHTQIYAHTDRCVELLKRLVSLEDNTHEQYLYETYTEGQALVYKSEFFDIFNQATHITGESYDYVAHVLEQVLSYEVFAARTKEGYFLGYTSLYRGLGHPYLEGSKFQGQAVSYMSSAMIRPDYQGQGIYGKLNSLRFNKALEHSPSIIFTRTQNPKVEKGMRSSLNKMQQSGKIKNWQLTRIKKAKAYGQQLTKERQIVDEREIQRAFDQLDTPSGDAYLLIFEIRYF